MPWDGAPGSVDHGDGEGEGGDSVRAVPHPRRRRRCRVHVPPHPVLGVPVGDHGLPLPHPKTPCRCEEGGKG